MTLPPLFDFTTDPGRAGWQATHDLAPPEWAADGLVLRATGNDPYAVGPLVAVPARTPLWLTLRLKTTQTGMGQVFYWAPGKGPTEPDSVRFPVRAGGWVDIRVPIPPLPADRCAFRIDPPGDSGGVTTVARIGVEPRVEFAEPVWPKPSRNPITGPSVRSGDAVLTHAARPDGFSLTIGGAAAALGSDRPRIGYQTDASAPLKWLDLAGATTRVSVRRGFLTARTEARDADGARWTLTRTFVPGQRAETFRVTSTVAVDRRRVLVYAPALIVHPLGRHDQALLCGVEYLERQDVSSSEADLRGPQAKRHVPDAYQLTIPLMATLSRGLWVSLDFERSDPVAACFDVPDRRFRSGGQLLGLLFPAGVRPPGSLLPSAGRAMAPGKKFTARATLRTGRSAANVLAPVEGWVADHGLPPVPDAGPVGERLRLAATGWLDSGVRAGGRGRYRHAYPGDFGPQPAADAAACQDWLARRVGGPAAERLRAAAAEARAAMPEDAIGGVGHVPTLAAALAYGRTEVALRRARGEASALLARFGRDGTISYRPGTVDYGSTHFARDANGLTGQVVSAALEAAARSGDPALIGAALERLRQLDTRFRNTVPRGAQTWEVPLHTPDILASGHLVKAFVLGYELSGDRKLWDAARYWAWTGVPFVYLTRPTSERVGLYGTTPVLGATGWIAPNWIGLPVQWCGLVYADALYDLASHEPNGPWRRLADGIVASGWQQTHPADAGARRGLLPDSFNLSAQIRNDVAINPATLLVPTARALGAPLCDRRALRPGGPLVYAPGRITVGKPGEIRIDGWPEGDYDVLVAGLRRAPQRILVEGRSNAFRYRIGGGWLIVQLRGSANLTLTE